MPESLRGQPYDEVVKSLQISEFFNLADLILISAEAMTAHFKQIDMTGATKSNPINTKLPPVDLDYLRLRDDDGNLLPDKMQEAFSIVTVYWDGKDKLGIEAGLVAGLWRRGMRADDILRYVRGFTGKDGKLITPSGRGADIMHAVLDTYMKQKGYRRNYEVPQSEMRDVVARWFTATRSAPIGSQEAANTVLHWSEYRRLGLIDDTGSAQIDQVHRVAKEVFSSEAPMSFESFSAWVGAQCPPRQRPASLSNKAVRAMLKKKRKQGRVNRNRGRR